MLKCANEMVAVASNQADSVRGVREDVERIDMPSKEEFERRYLASGTPVLLRGFVDHWPAFKRWGDFSYLRKAAGTSVIPVSFGEDFVRDAAAHHQSRDLTLSAYLDLLETGRTREERLYASDVPLVKMAPLVEDVVDPPWYKNTEDDLARHSRVLFFGRDTYTPAHHHSNNMSFLCQVSGEKRMTLFSPAESGKLYPYSVWSWLRQGRNPTTSAVDLEKPDYDRHPRYRQAKALKCTVRAGEMLFIPVHWWHAVWSPGLSMAVTYNFNAPLHLWSFPNPGLLSLAAQGYQAVYDRLDSWNARRARVGAKR